MFTAFMLMLMMHAAPARVPFLLEAQQRVGVACLPSSEARLAIARNKLANPLPALRTLARRAQAEPLRSRLCRLDERFVYEMTLLRRDGKVARVFVDAQDGRTPVAAPR
ncbi:MAG: PepSY domain-containing protein [Beijerinckiaceae bacterium]